jgi:HlyD family secretion protein
MKRLEKHAGDSVKKGEVLPHVMLDYLRPVKSPTSGTVLKVYREKSLTLPVGALFRSRNDWAMYKVVKQCAVKATVKIAETSGSAALVESGVNEGDEVI